MKQAEELDNILNSIKEKITFCLYIKVRDENIFERLSGRRICSNCGTVYHIKFNPPSRENVCDQCGAELIQRQDDKLEIVKKRVAESKERLLKIIKYYREKGILEIVDGSDKTPDQVHKKVQKVVQKHL